MIYIVGAGPGDLGLLTLRGYEVLKRADIVIYDNLVGEGILSIIPETAEKLDAGKSAGHHKMKQSEIEAALIKLSSSGKNIVRLKGGDPFLFGRGGEEAEALMREGINFEIVPGVCSALSVPAYAGIPATHRDYSSGVKIFTAHDKNNLIPNSDSSTSIFLMGVANSEALQNELLKTMKPLTPCSIIENGTKSSQRVVRTTLAEL
ncbi:MAG: uroporphyrinogen-III C-methyltransferase, partial [Synergistaceae bacterium]|nr:uroporphyrinogen-III C-methyltransferase [Synergistaceae bacterium]